MKVTSFEKEVYKKYKEQILGINEHFDDCPNKGRSTPIDECMCDCYKMQVFNLGRKAEKDAFYNSDTRKKVFS